MYFENCKNMSGISYSSFIYMIDNVDTYLIQGSSPGK